uniref:Bromodomain-containing protein 8 n=1 Tax=Denticeps clupeoides TaxID=299321 RepID=A0AAY4AKB1_9TELE
MASGVGKHKLLSLGPTEPWSVSEKLCLASSVMKSGDQNWVSVSRAIKPFAEPGRPPDWFSQKHCASQYSELLETTETPKRKRGEKGEVVETIEDVIVRKLTAERIEELKRLIKDTQEKHRKLKREAELIQAGNLDSKLEELWGDILQKKKQEEEEAEMKRKATDAAYQARQAVKNAPKRLSGVTVRSPTGASSPSLDFSLSDTPLSTPDEPSASVSPLIQSAVSPWRHSGHQRIPDLLSQVGEGDVPGGHMAGAHALPASQAATGAPTLSRLLEAGPAQFPSPLGSLATADAPTASAVPALDPATSLSTGLSPSLSLCVDVVTASVSGVLIHPDSAEHKAVELAEDDLVTVSYMGEELDLETVGDIIAIIEDKAGHSLDLITASSYFSIFFFFGEMIYSKWKVQCKAEINPKFIANLPDHYTQIRVRIEEELLSDGEEGSVSELKEGQEEDAAEECGLDEEGEGAEPYLSEAEGEAELEPPASESEDGYIPCVTLNISTTHTCDQEAIQAQKIWKKAIMLVWRAAANHRYANVFLQPVTDDIAPGYHSIVHRPMDLSTIKKNIETGLIRTTAEFQRDIMLMFQNAVMYNSSDHDVFHMALEMQRDVLEQIQQFLATQLIMQTSESSISAKSLRGRETNRKQDPNDKDTVPMASPAFLLSLFDGGTRGRRCAIEADLKMKK